MAFRILTIDGGGARGVYPAHFLARLMAALKQSPPTMFDLIAGTSTGAIIAAAAALDYPLDTLTTLYETEAPKIFKRRWSARGYLRSAYASEPLEALATTLFGQQTMSDAKTRLLLPATDASNGSVFVTKSPYLDSFVRDKDTTIVDAVMASCAAPSYFDPRKVSAYLLADGGLWANNPSLIAYVEAVGKLQIPEADIRILSLGTGTGHQYYDVGKAGDVSWGLARGWNGPQLLDLVFNLQSQSAANMAALLLGQRYRRVNFEETGNIALDDVSRLPALKAKADQAFTYQFQDIKDFLSV